jgi:hypothetical protein
MNRRRLAIAVVVVALVALLIWGGGSGAVDDLVGAVVNGPRFGPATTLGADGLVADDPNELAAAAGLPLDTYALARALMSEHGLDPDPYLTAVGWAIRNYAAERGQTVAAVLLGGSGNSRGHFGAQNAAAGKKYASTQQDPRQRHVKVATAVLAAPPLMDPTGGATHFFSPSAQDALASRSASGYTKDAASTIATWTAPGYFYPSGAELIVPPGIDGDRLSLFRRAA